MDGDAAPLVFVMLNPSTADAERDDPTIRRCLWFSRREGAGGIVVVNLCPWRATDPRDLYRAHERGEDVLWLDHNAEVLREARMFGPFVCAWGGGARPWMDSAVAKVREIGGECLLCLGTTRDGMPRHPLMLRRDAALRRFS